MYLVKTKDVYPRDDFNPIYSIGANQSPFNLFKRHLDETRSPDEVKISSWREKVIQKGLSF